MNKRTISYKNWLDAKLTDPDRAARFLNAAQEDSPAMFFKALRKVAAAQSRPMTEVAEAAGVSRESLIVGLQRKSNPTYNSLDGILKTLGFRLIVEPLPDPNRVKAAGSGSHHIAILDVAKNADSQSEVFDKSSRLANMPLATIARTYSSLGMQFRNGDVGLLSWIPQDIPYGGVQFGLGLNRRSITSKLGTVAYLLSSNNSAPSTLHFAGISPQ